MWPEYEDKQEDDSDLLSFLKTTPVVKDNHIDEDSICEGERFSDSTSHCVEFSALSVGQLSNFVCASEMAMENVVDESSR